MRTPATEACSRRLKSWLWLSVGLLTLVPSAGCRNQRQELVESELRCKMQRIEELEKERSRLNSEVGRLEAELESHQRRAAQSEQRDRVHGCGIRCGDPAASGCAVGGAVGPWPENSPPIAPLIDFIGDGASDSEASVPVTQTAFTQPSFDTRVMTHMPSSGLTRT